MEKRERERKRGKEERQTDKDRQAFTPSTQKVEAGRVRPAWLTKNSSRDSQGYTEKPSLENKPKKVQNKFAFECYHLIDCLS